MKKKIKDKNKNLVDQKKPFYKRNWFLIIAIIFVFGLVRDLFSGTNTPKTDPKIENVKTSNSTEVESSTVEVEEEEKTIKLIAGELGEFGKKITMNEGTDMPEDLIVYYLPTGTYEVENIGSYLVQVSGYDDYTNIGDAKRIEVGKKDTITVPTGWFVEVHEPAKLKLTKR